MKRLVLFVFVISIEIVAYSQTNTFPANGNVGIGTDSPAAPLQINSDLSSGNLFQIYDYGVFRSGVSYTGTQIWYLNNTASEAGSISITTPGGYPGITFFTDSSGNYINRFNILNEGDYFGMGYNNISTTLSINQFGEVGIGTTTPAGNLQVMNSLAGFDGSNIIYLTNDNTSYGRTNLILTGRLSNANDAWSFGSQARNSIVFNVNSAAVGANIGAIGTEYYSIQLEGNSKSLGFLSSQNGASPNMVLLQNGNIGVGTTSPQSKLAVNGTITGQEVKVTQTGWSDFVFDSAYRLPRLSNITNYIKTYHHLPDIPSAEQIENKGLNLGNMEKKQMQKIEELTLYQINADKRITQLEKELSELKEEVEQLKNKSR